MVCTFFGHRDFYCKDKDILKSAILRLIVEEGVNVFYVGNNGNFDYSAQRALLEVKKIRTDVNYYIVLSRIDERADFGDDGATVFPQGLQSVPPRFAISKRNDWRIRNSDFVIAYQKHGFSNCSRWVEKAKKRGLTVINL